MKESESFDRADASIAVGALVCLPAFSQQPAAPASAPQTPTVKTTAEEVASGHYRPRQEGQAGNRPRRRKN